MLGASSPESLLKSKKRTDNKVNIATRNLFQESGRLLRAASASKPLEASVPQPKSLSSFLNSFHLNKRPKDSSKSIDDRIMAIKEKPWAKHLSNDELLNIANTQPKISSDGLQMPRAKRNDWRKKLAGLVPKLHRPALDKLNNDLEGRIRQQTPKPHFKKAPANWQGVTPKVEPIDEAFSEEENVAEPNDVVVDANEEEDQIGGSEEPETHELPASDTPIKPISLIIQSSDEEEEIDLNDAAVKENKQKVQTDIKAFFGVPSASVESMRDSAKQLLTEKSKRRKDIKLRRKFLDEEAEESQDDDNSDAEPGMSKRRKKGRRRLDDEFVDEEEIKRELEASKFIAADDHDSADDHGDLTLVHNQLEMARDAEALQLVVDRFARDKLDPKAHHITKLATKYNNGGDDDDEHEFQQFDQFDFKTGDDEDRDHFSDLIQADSDAEISSLESDMDEIGDIDGSPPSSSSRLLNSLQLDSTSTRDNNTGNGDDDDDDVLNEQPDALVCPRFKGFPMSFEERLLEKLQSPGSAGGSLSKTQSIQRSGFTVGNSIAAD